MLLLEETDLLFVLKTSFQEVGQVVDTHFLGRDTAVLLHHYVMRNAVELEELAHVLVFRVRQAVAGFAFQVLLHIVRIGFLGRFVFAGDVDKLEFGMVMVLLAQVGCGLYASPTGTAGGCPEVDKQYLARMRSDNTAEDVGGFPLRQLIGCRSGFGTQLFQQIAGRGSQVGMGKGLLHPAEEDFGILSPLQYIGQRRTQVTHTGYLPEQGRGRGAQAVDDTVFFLIESQLKLQHPFVAGQSLESFIVLQVFLILIDSGKGTHELKAVDEDSNRQICQCRRIVQRYFFQEW